MRNKLSHDEAQHLVLDEDDLLGRLAVEVTLHGGAAERELADLVFGSTGGDLQAVADLATNCGRARARFPR